MTQPDDSAIEQLPAPAGRLSSILFVTALAHGIVILGITFSSAIDNSQDESPVLKVSLVTGPSDQNVEDAQYLSNQDHSGSGDTADARRPTTSISTADLMNVAGDNRGADLSDARERMPAPTADRVLTSGDSRQQLAADPNATEATANRPERAANMVNIDSGQSRAAELDIQMRSPLNESDDPQGPSTVRSILAVYLSDWRTRVERIGTANFPREFLAGNQATRRPTLEVAIAADGSLRDIVVRRTSGDRRVDQAAVNILRLAAPFDELPTAVEQAYGEIRFAYEWDFFQAGGDF
jgi:protein TonB